MLRPKVLLALLVFAQVVRADEVHITVLATTDLHGFIYPYDYFTAKPAERGLAKIATLIRQARRESAHTLLVDCGDTIQGSSLEAVYQSWVGGAKYSGEPPPRDPMMAAMSRLGYDAMALGNHEFNFGLKNLGRARKDASFPWLSANTIAEAGAQPFAPYLVKSVAGVKVAIIGITTPAVPTWEKPENYRGYRFVDGKEAAAAAVAELRAKHQPDLILVAAHSGLDREGRAGAENMVDRIAAEVSGIDAIVFGHTHAELAGETVNGALLVQPKNWGSSLARLDFTMKKGGGGWKVAAKRSRLIPVTAEVAADEEILKMARPYHELTERYLETPVAESPADLDAALGRVRDTALIDAVHAVQMHYAKADVSFTASFNPGASIPRGPVTVRQLAALYLYDNELYAVEGNGRMVREALENAARFFLSCRNEACSGEPLLNRSVIGFNFDMAQGISYDIDLRRPEGSRIADLRWRGRPLGDDQALRIAVNNYRAGGSAGYTMFRDAKVLWRSHEGIRELMIAYFGERRLLPEKADGNWRVLPPAAAARLEQEAREEAERNRNR